MVGAKSKGRSAPSIAKGPETKAAPEALLKDLRRGSEEENGVVSMPKPGERSMNPGLAQDERRRPTSKPPGWPRGQRVPA